MFIGQMVAALRRQQVFAMSAGLQLREYHHVDDVAGAVERLLSRSSWNLDPTQPLSSGHPIQLATMARAIFDFIGRGGDLRIAELATPAGENMRHEFPAAPAWLLGPSREPVAGVCAWVAALLRDA
jgi:nucleoside-diphosphate-sugar epimerase